MPDKRTLQRAAKDKREGKAPTTQAAEFVREEIEHIREGRHGARSAKQAIAIGLSKARRAGVELPPPKKGATSERTRLSTKRDYDAGHEADKPVSRKRSRATTKALKREPRAAASKRALSSHARAAARKRTGSERSAAARKAAKTKGPAVRSQAARKAAKTRSTKRSSAGRKTASKRR
jgi:hypothetical protein